MKKVLFLIESLGGGGAEKVLCDLATNLDKEQFQITVKTVTDSGIYYEQISKKCSVYSILHERDYSMGGLNRLFYRIKYYCVYHLPSRLIYELWIKGEYDVLVAFVEGFATKIIAADGTNHRKIAWVHVDPIERDYADAYFNSLENQQNAYSKFNNIVCVSNSVATSFRRKIGSVSSIQTIYNPIDKDAILKKGITDRKKNEIEKRKKIHFIAVGRLETQKGFDRLICAFSHYPKDRYSLSILGEGTQRNELERLIQQYQIQDSIKLLGFQENPYKYMGEADVFICSSRAEGFSLVIAEAMVLGLPIITTECSGPNELIDNGKYGIMVNNSIEGLMNGISFFLEDRSRVMKYSELSAMRSKSFDFEKTLEKVERVLNGDIE